jgi:hypothetical protein
VEHGRAEDEAKAEICCALNDGQFDHYYRANLTKPDVTESCYLASLRARGIPKRQLILPRDLAPGGIDWEKSCPTTRWRDNWGRLVQVTKLELSAKRATQVFRLDAVDASSRKASAPRGREQPVRFWARRAIEECCPKGVPSQAELPNPALIEQVMDLAKRNEWRVGGKDTILRAAGRRPK